MNIRSVCAPGSPGGVHLEDEVLLEPLHLHSCQCRHFRSINLVGHCGEGEFSFFRRWRNKYFLRSGVRSAQQAGDELHKAPHPPLCHPPSCKPSEAHHRQRNGGKQQESQSLKFKTSSVPPQDLREFYDPDTVDLMQWIDQNSEPDDAFSGSMQLLAGVKLCTGRTLTNHPHFEDKALRDRTKELYQMYAKVGDAGQEVGQDMFLQSGQPIGRPHKPEEIQRILCDP